MGAGNQQERLDTNWVVGFVDGEGCFHVAINKLPKMSLGWQVLPEFRVVQHQRDEGTLHQIREFFGLGVVTRNHGDRMEFRARGMENLNKIIEFFKKHPFKTSAKQRSFEQFCQVIKMMDNKEHLTREGLDKIASIAAEMNRKPRLKYLESSETIRQTSHEGSGL